ncbi:unnamed protein product [Peniophora sp. CBMAI 1063]|nr:unnamed protein product [Peniophora sp. CBMAI 1063]
MPAARNAKGAGRTGDDVMPNAARLGPMSGIPLQSSRSGYRARRPSTTAAGTKGDALSRQVPRALRPATEDRPRTDAELAREATVRADPLADVQSPLWVRCRRCSQRIKLSPKSYFDLFHWQKHRERCLRRPDEELSVADTCDELPQRTARSPSSAAPVGDGGGAEQDGLPQVQEEADPSPTMLIPSPLSPHAESRSTSPSQVVDCRVSVGTTTDEDNEATTPPPPYYPHDVFNHSSPVSSSPPAFGMSLGRPDIDAAATLTSFNTKSPAELFTRCMRRLPSERAPPLLEPRTPLVYESRAQLSPSPTPWESWTYEYLSPAIWTMGESSVEPLDIRVPTSNVRASN